jgi:hypothetical protein
MILVRPSLLLFLSHLPSLSHPGLLSLPATQRHRSAANGAAEIVTHRVEEAVAAVAAVAVEAAVHVSGHSVGVLASVPAALTAWASVQEVEVEVEAAVEAVVMVIQMTAQAAAVVRRRRSARNVAPFTTSPTPDRPHVGILTAREPSLPVAHPAPPRLQPLVLHAHSS